MAWGDFVVGKSWTFTEILLENGGKSGFSDTPGVKIQHFELKMMDFGTNLEKSWGEMGQESV